MNDLRITKVIQNLMLTALYEKSGVEALFPDVRSKCEALIEKQKQLGRPIWIHSTFRTAKEQDDLYAQGRIRPGSIVTNARGLQSYHNYCLAFDAVFLGHLWNPPSESWWEELGQEGEKLGLEWGGRWPSPDRPHFEWHPDFTWQELEARIKVIQDIDKADSLLARIRAMFGL